MSYNNKVELCNVSNILAFSNHFNVDMPYSFLHLLARVLGKCYINDSESCLIRYNTCKWITESDHDIFKDSLWDTPKKEALDWLKENRSKYEGIKG